MLPGLLSLVIWAVRVSGIKSFAQVELDVVLAKLFVAIALSQTRREGLLRKGKRGLN